MASNSDDNMNLDSRTPSRPSTPTPTDRCIRYSEMTEELRGLTTSINANQSLIKEMIRFGNLYADDECIAMQQNLLQDLEMKHHQKVSEFNSLSPCDTPGCQRHHTPPSSPVKLNLASQQSNNEILNQTQNKSSSQKRKENEDGFTSPPLSKVNKRTKNSTQLNFEIELSNKFKSLNQEQARTSTENENDETNEQNHNTTTIPQNLPPPVMLKINENYHSEMKIITDKFPTVRGKLSGEYLKLYTNTTEQKDQLIEFLEVVDFQFYAIRAKSERPIKVVIKGLPRDTDTNNIHHELVMLGYTIDKVTQLTGRITKQKLPVFLVTHPRNIFNSKIFDLNRLCYLVVNVEGYEGKGVTQCYSCNKFNHTSDLCHLKPRCRKCGLGHQTKDCEINKVEQMYCINCETVGHMANYAKCPLYPKPKKGAPTKNNNYTSIINSIVRPNSTYANATKTTTNSNRNQQMATRISGSSSVPPQVQTNQVNVLTPQITPIQTANSNPNVNLIAQTLQSVIQALTTLTVQINNMNFTPPSVHNKPNKNKTNEVKKQEMYALVDETHLRPSHNININNYKCYRNDRQTAGRPSGGTLILIKKSLPHYNTPIPQLFHVEATTVTINPPNFDPLSITSIYVPPPSDKLLFTLDLETIMQVNSHCVIFGDFNATHKYWNCSRNSTRGTQLKNFCDQVNLEIIYPDSPTRYGYNTSNTLDIALVNDFNFPYDISSLAELSSDHNPVLLNFNFSLPIHEENPRAITTCWRLFRKCLNNNVIIGNYASINNPFALEEKIATFTEAVCSAHLECE
ncbi:nucleic-acid-binding protein from transposon X-element [Trichonephila clavipes]|nr:nucleic-acid-binding protein from transposon X-element [Trichonephila clavipes]